MKSPHRAICWELWRTTRRELSMRLCGASAYALLLSRVGPSNGNPAESQVVSGILVLMLTSIALASPAWILQFDRTQVGFGFRSNFIRPVSTGTLVAIPMLYTMISSAACYVIPALLFRGQTGVAVPIIGPSVIILCATTCFVAAGWSPATITGRAVAVVTLAAALLIVIVAGRQDHSTPWLMAIGSPTQFNFRWYQYVGLSIVAALAYLTALLSVKQQRRGDHWMPDSWSQAMPFSAATLKQPSATNAPRPFSRPAAAQYWYEFQRFGIRTLLISLLAPLAVVIAIVVAAHTSTRTSTSAVWALVLVICPVVYQVIGIDGAVGLKQKQRVMFLPLFDATRPMSSVQLIEIKLVMIAACSVVGWLFMVLAWAIHAIVSGDIGSWDSSGEAAWGLLREAPIWVWGIVLSGALVLIISNSSLLLAGWLWMPFHPKICFGLSVFGALHVLLVVWDADHGWVLLPLWRIYGYLLPLTIIIGCAIALYKAYHAGVLRSRLFGLALAAWLVYLAALAAAYTTFDPQLTVVPAAQAFTIAVAWLLVPLAAVAVAPLALDRLRHEAIG